MAENKPKATGSICIMPGVGEFAPLLKKLGKFKTGKSCLYIKHPDRRRSGVADGKNWRAR